MAYDASRAGREHSACDERAFECIVAAHAVDHHLAGEPTDQARERCEWRWCGHRDGVVFRELRARRGDVRSAGRKRETEHARGERAGRCKRKRARRCTHDVATPLALSGSNLRADVTRPGIFAAPRGYACVTSPSC